MIGRYYSFVFLGTSKRKYELSSYLTFRSGRVRDTNWLNSCKRTHERTKQNDIALYSPIGRGYLKNSWCQYGYKTHSSSVCTICTSQEPWAKCRQRQTMDATGRLAAAEEAKSEMKNEKERSKDACECESRFGSSLIRWTWSGQLIANTTYECTRRYGEVGFDSTRRNYYLSDTRVVR